MLATIALPRGGPPDTEIPTAHGRHPRQRTVHRHRTREQRSAVPARPVDAGPRARGGQDAAWRLRARSEEHTSELQSLMRISYAVFCLKKNKETYTTLTQRWNK